MGQVWPWTLKISKIEPYSGMQHQYLFPKETMCSSVLHKAEEPPALLTTSERQKYDLRVLKYKIEIL